MNGTARGQAQRYVTPSSALNALPIHFYCRRVRSRRTALKPVPPCLSSRRPRTGNVIRSAAFLRPIRTGDMHDGRVDAHERSCSGRVNRPGFSRPLLPLCVWLFSYCQFSLRTMRSASWPQIRLGNRTDSLTLFRGTIILCSCTTVACSSSKWDSFWSGS